MKILVAGASGYVGSHLVPLLESSGFEVLRLVREKKEGEKALASDLLMDDRLAEKLEGVEVVVYLVHSLEKEDYSALDRLAAENMGRACQRASVKRIVYLGGLGHPDFPLSKHLKSRHDTGEALRESAPKVEVIELRASVIIGAGSLSFEMIRALTERLPVMVTPKWVRTPLQPISIQDVLAYIREALSLPFRGNKIYEIGGHNVTSYKELMLDYAKVKRLKRWMIPVPVITPYLSSLWLSLVTPLYAKVGRKLVESATVATVVSNDRAKEDFSVKPMTCQEALKKAIVEEEKEIASHRWSQKIKPGNFLVDCRSCKVPLTKEQAFVPIYQIGGKKGWYYANFLWQIRGWLDEIVGGPGLRIGRKETIHEGDPLDFWKVKTLKPNEMLTLQAEMKVPGSAYLSFELISTGEETEIFQTAIFQPRGLLGLMYWYSLVPIHAFIFQGMLNAIKDLAISEAKRR